MWLRQLLAVIASVVVLVACTKAAPTSIAPTAIEEELAVSVDSVADPTGDAESASDQTQTGWLNPRTVVNALPPLAGWAIDREPQLVNSAPVQPPRQEDLETGCPTRLALNLAMADSDLVSFAHHLPESPQTSLRRIVITVGDYAEHDDVDRIDRLFLTMPSHCPTIELGRDMVGVTRQLDIGSPAYAGSSYTRPETEPSSGESWNVLLTRENVAVHLTGVGVNDAAAEQLFVEFVAEARQSLESVPFDTEIDPDTCTNQDTASDPMTC